MNNDIYTADYTRSLPDVIKNDETLYAIAQVAAEEMRVLMEATKYAVIYPNIEKLPEELLDIIAYDFKVDWWDSSYSLEEKRKTLKDSWNVRRHLGTKYAVETAISAIYPDTKVEEWFEYDGAPYTFKLLIDATYESIDPKKHQRVLDNAEYYKNLRSHLEGVEYVVRPNGTAIAYSAAALADMHMSITAEVNVYGLE